jgi:hypothetical protein
MRQLLILSLTVLCLCQCTKIDETKNDPYNEWLIKMIVEKEVEKEKDCGYKNGFMILEPVTDLCNIWGEYLFEEYTIEELNLPDYDIQPLLDSFCLHNDSRIQLSLKTDTIKGYYVNLGKSIEMEQPIKGRSDFPGSFGVIKVSIPAYDEVQNITLVYVEKGFGVLLEIGELVLYKYENGSLIELKRVMLWQS